MIFDLIYIPSEFQNIIIIIIIFTIATTLAIIFNIRNIIFILLVMILIILFLYFMNLINLEISIFGFLLIPLLIMFICRSEKSNEID